jgi:hypothetical protein
MHRRRSVTDRKTVAGAYALAQEALDKQEGHEDVCAIRYGAINITLGELKAAAEKQSTLLWGIVLSVAAFALVTLVAVVLHALKLA